MSIMEKPEVEFVELVDILTNDSIECTTEQCNLQGCPEDTCSNFGW